MRSEQEVRELLERLEEVTEAISEAGGGEDPDCVYANSVCDALSWVLGEISTEDFLSDAYLDIRRLERLGAKGR